VVTYIVITKKQHGEKGALQFFQVESTVHDGGWRAKIQGVSDIGDTFAMGRGKSIKDIGLPLFFV
jgi:hypothetical protein